LQADQLYDTSGFLIKELNKASDVLSEMQGQIMKGREVVTSPLKRRADTSSDEKGSSGSGSGAPIDMTTDGTVSVEMEQPPVPSHIFAVPSNSLIELRAVTLGIMKRAIEEMWSLNPQADMPELPSQVIELLQREVEKRPEQTGVWQQRLAMYSQVEGNPPTGAVTWNRAKPKEDAVVGDAVA